MSLGQRSILIEMVILIVIVPLTSNYNLLENCKTMQNMSPKSPKNCPKKTILCPAAVQEAPFRFPRDHSVVLDSAGQSSSCQDFMLSWSQYPLAKDTSIDVPLISFGS